VFFGGCPRRLVECKALMRGDDNRGHPWVASPPCIVMTHAFSHLRDESGLRGEVTIQRWGGTGFDRKLCLCLGARVVE
jgi:hypothetical protein